MPEMTELFFHLTQWYRIYKRDLPWRKTKNPYHIWVSEIMLQQTRVEAVKPYYIRFLQELPTVKDLAEADEEQLLKLWEGLGYYSRVRNMQAAARQVMAMFHGNIPADYHALLRLKGIGPYTAGAIASIAFSLPCAAVDGNVLRVMSRIFADTRDIGLQQTKKAWEQEIQTALTEFNAGEVNQALMELGATVCLPNGLPKCNICPLRIYCMAYQQDTAMQYPVKSEKKPRTKEFLAVCFLTDGKQIAIRKREAKGLLANLWELPHVPQDHALPIALHAWGITEADIIPMHGQKHIFTHVEWHMDCYFVKVIQKTDTPFTWITPQEAVEQYALPTAFKKIYQEGMHHLTELGMQMTLHFEGK
ncbi:MAG TPA: A/G-specific adenine glycosylase [Candidatus Anaerotignum merdipullorum]|nr:A/G-specific adenine glycosylase [Candidatus Anaerotignum merdipullorum]